MPDEKIGEQVVTFTAPHPARTDSPEYLRSRAWLMEQGSGGCYICGGPVDLSHPGAPGDPQDPPRPAEIIAARDRKCEMSGHPGVRELGERRPRRRARARGRGPWP